MSDTLRDQLEAAYNSSTEEPEEVEAVEEEVVEAAVEPEEVAEDVEPSQEETEDDVPVPDHWASEDKEVFKALDKRGKEFLIRRHKEMEAGYTKKAQALSESAKVAESYKSMMSPHEAYL